MRRLWEDEIRRAIREAVFFILMRGLLRATGEEGAGS
jgi:hypothetical protein